jgi:hypothetical protein
VFGSVPLEGVAYLQLGCAKLCSQFTLLHAYRDNLYLGPIRNLIALMVRAVGREWQREAQNVDGKLSPELFGCHPPVDQKDADIGLAGPLEYHLLDVHLVAVSKVIFGRHAESLQDGGSVHAEPRRTS